MFHRLLSIVLVLVLSTFSFAQEKPKTDPDAQRKKSDDAARALLQKRLPSVNFANVNLRDAIDFFRDVTGANIYTSWRDLKAAGIDQSTQVNINVKDVTFEKVLNLIITDLGGKDKIAWVVDEGVILISSPEKLRGLTFIRIYEVGDMIDARVPQNKGDVLISIITQCISPTTWADAGGNAAIKFRDGKLVVTQTAENHQAIANLLDGLREFRK